VNCAGIKEAGTFSLPVEVNVPVYLNAAASTPKMVTVTVQEVESPDAGESSGNDETANADGG
jgi:hypothetical protein